MSTNYYLRTNICPCCNRFDQVHLGKKSGGWSFSFNGVPFKSLFDVWGAIIAPQAQIIDEYGKPLTPDQFRTMVEESADDWTYDRYCAANPDMPAIPVGPDDHFMADGFDFWTREFS